MVLRESKKVDIDFKSADFKLEDSFGKTVSRDQIMGPNGLLIVFTCNHCPYAVALWDRLITLSNVIKDQGVHTVAINPNINPNYPSDSPEHMRILVESKGLPFPYLVDSNQEVARLYDAQCTPDIYLLDKDQDCFYHGCFDDNWKDESQVQSHDLSMAINCMLKDNKMVNVRPSMGCSIKWNE